MRAVYAKSVIPSFVIYSRKTTNLKQLTDSDGACQKEFKIRKVLYYVVDRCFVWERSFKKHSDQ